MSGALRPTPFVSSRPVPSASSAVHGEPYARDHGHAQGHAHHHHPVVAPQARIPAASLLRGSAVGRLGGVAIALGLMWAAVLWALA